MGGYEDHGRTGRDFGQDLHSVGSGHLDVQEYDIHIVGLIQPLEEGQAVSELTDNRALRFLEQSGQPFPCQGFVVDHQGV